MARAVAALAIAILIADCRRGDPLLQPSPKSLQQAAPDSFLVRFETTRGTFDAMAHRDWAPHGVDRFHYLVAHHYYDGARFFRVVPRFVAQFGMSGDTAVIRAWHDRRIPDDPVRHTNARGTISFAREGPATRTVQLYVNLRDNARLDTLGGFGFPPLAEVRAGMAVVDSLYAAYGDGPPRGTGPSQDSIATEGNAYLVRRFPKLDWIRRATLVREWK